MSLTHEDLEFVLQIAAVRIGISSLALLWSVGRLLLGVLSEDE